MKRFILTVLCVSVFFIGIGSIIEKTSAKFTSDAKALELIQKARIAIGGDTNLRQVNSMTIVGSTTNFFEKEGIQNTKIGGLEINMQLPNQFSKMVKIGDPSNSASDIQVQKEIFVVKRGEGDVNFKGENGTEGVFVLKRDGDQEMKWTPESGTNVKIEGDKITITKEDGTTEEIKTDGQHKIRIHKDKDGNLVRENIDGTEGKNTFIIKGQDGNVITEDVENINGKKVVIVKDTDGNVRTENIVGPHKMRFGPDSGMRQNEMLRTTMALLLTAPEGQDVSYKFVGTGNVDGNSSNIIEVSSNGSSFKLYLNTSTNLPQMVSYLGHQNVFFVQKDNGNNLENGKVIKLEGMIKDSDQSEHQIKFSDFRNVGNLLLPHRWSESVNGKQSQIIDITTYDINPTNIADKFSKDRVMIHKIKPTDNN